MAHLAVREISTSGSSNWVFRLGDELAVRLPRTDGYTLDLLNEVRWLPHLVARLPVPVPQVFAVGEPTEHFSRPWAVVSWLTGDLPAAPDMAQQGRFALTLGDFLRALHAIDTEGAPTGEAWGYRCGEPVTDTIDEWADRAATALSDLFDQAAVREAWRRLRDVPTATAPACLVHTDLSAENLLTHPDRRLAGVIDFGGMGVGDRSVDLLYAWSFLDAAARQQLRVSAGVDDETWIRARAWAFVGPGLLTVANYRDSMPARTERLTGWSRPSRPRLAYGCVERASDPRRCLESVAANVLESAPHVPSELAHWRGMTSETRIAEQRPDHYDAFAEAYARENEHGLFTKWYARPAVLDLLGSVTGHRILDAGCGSGPLLADLKERGASVAGFDASPAMVRIARERLGDEADLQVADLSQPLPYDDEVFDDALAVLVLHYLEDWSGPLGELRRTLKPCGRLVVVVNHPLIPPVMYPEVNYFATVPNEEEYEFDGVSVKLTIWYRSLHAMSEWFTAAGFRIAAISEPPVSPDTPPELLPPSKSDPTRFIGFIFFTLEVIS